MTEITQHGEQKHKMSKEKWTEASSAMIKSGKLSPNTRKSRGCLVSPLLVNIVLEVLAQQLDKENKHEAFEVDRKT